jgi:hypothetical protein
MSVYTFFIQTFPYTIYPSDASWASVFLGFSRIYTRGTNTMGPSGRTHVTRSNPMQFQRAQSRDIGVSKYKLVIMSFFDVAYLF